MLNIEIVLFNIIFLSMTIIPIIGAIYILTHKDRGTTKYSVFIHNNDDWF